MAGFAMTSGERVYSKSRGGVLKRFARKVKRRYANRAKFRYRKPNVVKGVQLWKKGNVGFPDVFDTKVVQTLRVVFPNGNLFGEFCGQLADPSTSLRQADVGDASGWLYPVTYDQPTYHYQLSQLYNDYLVRGAKISLHIIPTGTIGPRVAMLCNDDPTAIHNTAQECDSFNQADGVRSKIVETSSQKNFFLTTYCNPHKIFGVKDLMDEKECWAGGSNVPYVHIVVDSMNHTTTTGCIVFLKIKYYMRYAYKLEVTPPI